MPQISWSCGVTPSEPLRDHDWFTLQRQRSELEDEADARAAGRSLSFGVFADDVLVGRLALTSIVRGAFQNVRVRLRSYGLPRTPV